MSFGRLAWCFGLVALALGGAACKSSDSGGDEGNGPVGEADFQARIAAETCSRTALCCSAAQQPFDEAKCEAQVREQLAGLVPDGGADAAAPARTFDGAKAAACLASIQAMPKTCEAMFEQTSWGTGNGLGVNRVGGPCSAIYHGTKAIGEACASTDECAPDKDGWYFCNPNAQAGDASGLGTCVQVQVIGGQCGDQSQPGMPGPYYVCADGTCDGFCEQISGPGGSCKQFTSTQCDKGLACVNDVCVAPPAVGEACPSNQCAEGAWCSQGTCAARKGDGEACTQGDECKKPYMCQAGKCTLPAGQMCTLGH